MQIPAFPIVHAPAFSMVHTSAANLHDDSWDEIFSRGEAMDENARNGVRNRSNLRRSVFLWSNHRALRGVRAKRRGETRSERKITGDGQVTITDDSGSKGFVRRAREKRYG